MTVIPNKLVWSLRYNELIKIFSLDSKAQISEEIFVTKINLKAKIYPAELSNNSVDYFLTEIILNDENVFYFYNEDYNEIDPDLAAMYDYLKKLYSDI